MEPYLVASLVLVAVVYAVLTDHQNKRHLGMVSVLIGEHMKEVAAQRSEIGLLHIAHREDVARLCQRIQAPELAVIEHQSQGPKEPDSMPLTDEQLARQQEEAEFIARVERMENEQIGILS